VSIANFSAVLAYQPLGVSTHRQHQSSPHATTAARWPPSPISANDVIAQNGYAGFAQGMAMEKGGAMKTAGQAMNGINWHAHLPKT
jgi:hypothetical protein